MSKEKVNVKLERLKQKKRNINELFEEFLESDKKGMAFVKLFGLAGELVEELINEQEEKIASGERRGAKNSIAILKLAIYTRVELIDELGEADWKLLVGEVTAKAKHEGIKSPNTVKKIMNEFREYIESTEANINFIEGMKRMKRMKLSQSTRK